MKILSHIVNRKSLFVNPLASILVLSFPLMTGCGTINNQFGSGDHRPYGGVRWDLSEMKTHDAELGEMAVLDIPCSAVLDTLLWPLDRLRASRKDKTP